jgi:hypothetical protein
VIIKKTIMVSLSFVVFFVASQLVSAVQANIGAFGSGLSTLIGYSAPTSTPTTSPTPSIEQSPSPSAFPVTCAEDVSESGTVGLEDYSILVSDFFKSNPINPRSNIDGVGLVDLSDYSLLVAKFFQDC